MNKQNNNIATERWAFFNFLLLVGIVILSLCYFYKDRCFYKETNYGLKYRIVEKAKNQNVDFKIRNYDFLIYERQVVYRKEILEHTNVFTNFNYGMHIPYFCSTRQYLNYNFNGDLEELLLFAKPGDVIEAEILASKVLSHEQIQGIFKKYGIFDENLKVTITIKITDVFNEEDFPKKMVEHQEKIRKLQQEQMKKAKETLKLSLKRRNKKCEEMEYGFLESINNIEGDFLNQNDKVTIDCTLRDFYSNKILSTTNMIEAKKANVYNKKNKYEPIVIDGSKMQSNFYVLLFHKFKNGGKYVFYSPLVSRFLGDRKLFSVEIDVVDALPGPRKDEEIKKENKGDNTVKKQGEDMDTKKEEVLGENKTVKKAPKENKGANEIKDSEGNKNIASVKIPKENKNIEKK